MKNRFFIRSMIFVLLFFISLPTHASGWIEKEKGTIQGLQGITKAGDNYFAVGNGSNIIRSTDNGNTWTVYDQSGNVYWQDIETTGTTVRAVGEGGTLRESTNNGLTWSQRKLEITDTFYDIDASSEHGYIVGTNGRILYYGSNTDTWNTTTSNTTLALFGVQDRGDGTAWVVGSEGILLKTTDSGITWTNKGKATDTDLLAVWFTSSSSGYVVGKNGTIRKTTDSGYSWSTISVSGLSTQTLYDIEAVGDDIVIVGDKIIVRSQDGGKTWTATDYTPQNFTLRDVYYPSTNELWIAGTKDDYQSVILKWEAVTETPVDTVISPEPVEGGTAEAVAGNLIKLACQVNAQINDPCKAVYFYASDGKRHAFPNDKVFFTWFDNFDSVKEVSSSFMSSLQLGKNVTYHPGTKMVKFQTVPTVYTVSKKGELRAIASEQIATELYGSTWNKQIDDISDAFVGNYTFGLKINSTSDYDVATEKTSVAGLDANF
ncbi:hypothetical protein HYV69_02335 [Candidatus Uhrbacteria bacterium]|nr:hypothetical protein [Candidatus Uhrbacteria bacterium]